MKHHNPLHKDGYFKPLLDCNGNLYSQLFRDPVDVAVLQSYLKVAGLWPSGFAELAESDVRRVLVRKGSRKPVSSLYYRAGAYDRPLAQWMVPLSEAIRRQHGPDALTSRFRTY